MSRILIGLIVVFMLRVGDIQGQGSGSGSAKVLVAYYSWGGNTRLVAREIQSLLGGDMFEIKPVASYPVDYNECVKQARLHARWWSSGESFQGHYLPLPQFGYEERICGRRDICSSFKA